MDLLESFKAFIKQHNLFGAKDKLLLAVSGGVDSVALCELCHQADYDFCIAHCNFQLRAEESERDEKFVRELAAKYGVELVVKKFDTGNYASENKLSIQEAARELRYEWFHELVSSRQSTASSQQSAVITYLLTAHHGDDNAETILMNFFRGTGLHGLTGIPVAGSFFSRNFVRRPLLAFSKEELIRFAKENNLEFVEDSSNFSSKYTRNLFRNEIIPAIAEVYPQVKHNLQANIERFSEIEKLYKLSVENIIKKLIRKKGNEFHIPVKQLMGFNNKALIYEIISRFGFSEKQVDEVLKLAKSESGRYSQSQDHSYRIIKHRHWFIISPAVSETNEHIIVEEGVKHLRFGNASLYFDSVPNSSITNSHTVENLDYKALQFPLLLRKWKTGDYFYPLGMKKKKKLSRFFIDQKLSKTQKENIWVLESNKKIAWVVGHRIDDRFKVTEKTKLVMRVRIER
jgi:tRNA(Ile)-lysidine synthase